ncbi:hypothetical protein HWV62_24005 [Athelia sp. TMB]|nr:hypothetical protein HWV62_24005 [Athelia sp. TMB]
MSRSGRFVDPLLRAILDTALTPDDNDLFMSNLVDTPILAIHGGADDNVPAWHSRELVDVLKTWNERADVTFHEIPEQPHWWPTVLNTKEVKAFIDRVSRSVGIEHDYSSTFTLTVAIPSASGSLHGWRIESLQTPGRLCGHKVRQFILDGKNVTLQSGASGIIRFHKDKGHKAVQLSGRMQEILSTSAPLVLVISDEPSSHTLSLALRIAHDLNKYHKLDSEILRGSEALALAEANRLGRGNIVVLGDGSPTFSQWCLSRISSSLGTVPQELRNLISAPGSTIGIMSLLPHPIDSAANMLWMRGDFSAIERARRLFPLRTGVPVPDMVVIDSSMDNMGAAGILAAGLDIP